MTDTRRCYLHVGTPKTGTSFLQSAFWASRDALATQGLELPLRGPRDHFWLTLALRGRLDDSMDSAGAHTVLDRLTQDLRGRRASRLLISHELLAPVDADQAARLHELLADHEVHVVITARDYARQIPAEWQQSVKHRNKATYEQFLTDLVARRSYFWAMQDVADVAARWRGSLPPERVHVVTVPAPGAPPGLLLERFCSVLEVDPRSLTTDATRANPSMGMAQTELLRRVNSALGDRLPHPRAGYAQVVKEQLGNRILAAQDGERPVLPARLEGWCRETAQEMVGRLELAGYDVAGDLAELLPARRAEAAEPPGEQTPVSDAEVAAAAVQALASLLDERHRDLEELRRLHRRRRPPDARSLVPRTVTALRRRLRVRRRPAP